MTSSDTGVVPTRGIAPQDTRLVLAVITSGAQTNLMGTIHGGEVMKLVDDAAGTIAARFSAGPAVTAAMDEMVFLAPVRVGDVLSVQGQINWAGRSSMEVGVRVEATRWDRVADPVHVASAYLVMVAVDAVGRPRSIPPLELDTSDDERRHAAAQVRRRHRLAMRADIERLHR